MNQSRLSLIKRAARVSWLREVRRRTRRGVDASIYALRGILLSIERRVRTSAVAVSSDGRRRILIVDDLLPDPLFGAGYPRAAAIVRSLTSAGIAVELYPMEASEADRVRINADFGNVVRFHAGRGAHGLRRLLWREGSRFDLIFVSRPRPMAALLAAKWRPTIPAPVIYDAEAVLAPRERRRVALFEGAWSDRQYRAALAAEMDLARTAAAITAVGPIDAELIRSVLDVPVFVLPHAVPVRRSAPGPGGRVDLLFVGRLTGTADQSPNVDSLRWFVTEVMPKLDALLGTDYRLHVSGRVEAPELAVLGSDRVVFHGVVGDLRPLYDRARLFVAPTRYAAGIPLKVLEAMGEGLPCVATPLLGEQLGAAAQTLPTGADAEAFATQCARLYRDDPVWTATQAAAFAHVEATGSPAAFDATLTALIDLVVRGSGRT